MQNTFPPSMVLHQVGLYSTPSIVIYEVGLYSTYTFPPSIVVRKVGLYNTPSHFPQLFTRQGYTVHLPTSYSCSQGRVIQYTFSSSIISNNIPSFPTVQYLLDNLHQTIFVHKHSVLIRNLVLQDTIIQLTGTQHISYFTIAARLKERYDKSE